MISSEFLIRRWRSSDSTDGTILSLSPLAISVGWVIVDRSTGVDRPHRLIAVSWVRNAFTVTFLSRSAVRSLRRSTNALAAGLPVELRLKNRNSFGSLRLSAARAMSP